MPNTPTAEIERDSDIDYAKACDFCGRDSDELKRTYFKNGYVDACPECQVEHAAEIVELTVEVIA